MAKRKIDNAKWRQIFGKILAVVFDRYSFDYETFAKEHYISSSTVRYWFLGRSCPSMSNLKDIKEFLVRAIPETSSVDEDVYSTILNYFQEQEAAITIYALRTRFPAMNSFIVEALDICFSFAKRREYVFNQRFTSSLPTGKTQAVVFDFDGTLTQNTSNKTTWEMIWTKLGYDIKICQDLHMEFNRGQLNHEQWCQVTSLLFRIKNLHRSTIESIASDIRLIPYAEETFRTLYERGIKIYIISGSILQIMKPAMSPLYPYIDDVKANDFCFGDNGILTGIVGTKYDFNRKADYILEIANSLKISPKDILFVGNSLNDQYAYLSGARTLCINPAVTDISNTIVWNNCIQSCADLREILAFIK